MWYTLCVKNTPRTYTGVIDVTRKGVGYFGLPDVADDIEIAPEDLGTALNGDEVEIRITGKRRGRTTGAVVRVITRTQDVFVGTLVQATDTACTLTADDRRFYPTLRIGTAQLHGGAPGDKVLARITRWANAHVDPIGEVVEVIGKAGEHETEIRAAVLSHGHALAFPAAVEQEATRIESHGLTGGFESGERRDMRSTVTFTIDPDDAKDFDDALSVRFLEDGLVEVGVHIADVSHYVRPKSILDVEAQKRATSIYLVDRTIPMLPEALSNNLCSLVPHQDRFTFSAIFTLTSDAHIVDRWFGKTYIHSDHRFTYASAQEVLDTGNGPHADELRLLETLGKKLRKDREKNGALAFETREVKFKLAPDGTPLSVYVKDRLETMKVIEDWMLLANTEVARFIAERVKGKNPIEQTSIYRIHDVPDSDRIEELRIFLKALGYSLGKDGQKVRPHDMQQLLAEIRGTENESLVTIATLRSMAKAVYSHKNIGHFSLNFSHYTHFTSPIRRYADVMVHRILESHLTGKPLSHEELLSYQRLALHASDREVAAVEAERDSIKYTQVKYMAGKIGQTFDGSISGVTEHGIFVAEASSLAEGFIHVSNLSDDYYQYNRKNFTLSGNNKRKAYRLGDKVRITLKHVNVELRQIDWQLAS
jgi:ribonuclease R